MIPIEQDTCMASLQHLTKTDGDPRVRRRAQMVLQTVEGQSLTAVAICFHTAPHCVRTWRDRFENEGRSGLVDRPRSGRPCKLNADDRQYLQGAVDHCPTDTGLPMTSWSLFDLQGVLARDRGVQVSVDTVQRTLLKLGFRYRRPRHDLTHRQDPDAVAATKQVLGWLEKKAVLTPSDCMWSLWMSVRSTPNLGWHRSGSDAVNP